MPRRLPSLRECFRFPLATPAARRDVLVGGTWMLALLIGWVVNMGHRLEVVYRVWHDEPPYFRGFRPFGYLFRRGLLALAAIAVNLTPALACGALTWRRWGRPGSGVTLGLAIALLLLGIFILPGGQTQNAAHRDASYLFRPDKALRVALAGGRAYLKAWLIAAAAISLTPLGLLGLGIGFFYTSVWAWTVVGYAFTQALVDRDGG